MIRRLSAALVAIALSATLVVVVRAPASAAALCATPGRDGSPTLSTVVNTYFAGSANASAGATSITVGAHATGDANVAIATGDLLLVIQMQGATINTSNSSSYGDGTGAGSGAISSTAGTFEYVVANGNLATTGGSIAIKGANSNGLINAYTTGSGATFQVIRVPQYVAPTIGTGLAPLAWTGTAGGVLAIDAQNLVSSGGATVNASGYGFRGGGARQLSGDATAGNGDWISPNTKNAHGTKGEGTAGTPTYLYSSLTTTETGSGTADGYTGGDKGRGAPGNAGGGGSDADAVNNDQNAGGGGGGNGGAGGIGGKTWSSDIADGGHGGTFTPSATQVVMGGGGGAGARNNSSGAMSSGGSGGGIVMMRMAGFTGTMTVTAGGLMGVDPQNDGGGGGGAGGSIVITGIATLGGITATALGANGTDADVINAGGAAHGPGGGGGGGVIVTSGGMSAATVTGGTPGSTDGSPDPDAHYGAAAGGTGQTLTLAHGSIPGASSGAECGSSPGTGLLIGPVGVPNATGSYDGNVAVTNNDDFVEKSFAPAAFNAINSSTTVGSPNGNTYTSAVTGIALRHQVHNYGAATSNVIYYAQAPAVGWTVAVYSDNAGVLGTQIGGTASSNTYQTTTTVAITAGADSFVWTVYAAPTGLQAFSRFDALLAVVDSGNTSNNNEVHDELYTSYVVQTKSFTITATNCSGSPPAGTWCPGATLKYTIDVRNIAVAANGTTPASATLTANTLLLTDDGSNANSWAKDGGYMNTPGTSSTGTAPTTVTYFYNATSSTTFPANFNTTNKVFKVTANWPTLTAGANAQFSFTAIQF